MTPALTGQDEAQHLSDNPPSDQAKQSKELQGTSNTSFSGGLVSSPPQSRISGKQAIHQQIAKLAVAGLTYNQIHDQLLEPVGQGSESPLSRRQVVYKRLQSNLGQKALAEEIGFTVAELDGKLREIAIDKPSVSDDNRVKAITVGYRRHGALKDVSETRTERITLNIDLSPQELALSLTQALKQASTGKGLVTPGESGRDDSTGQVGQNKP